MTELSRTINVTDRTGAALTLIELVNRPGLFAVMDRADWDQWVAEGLPQALYAILGTGRLRWTVAHRSGRRPRSFTNAAKAILKPPSGYVAARRSADPLNLRRSNLRLIKAAPGVAL